MGQRQVQRPRLVPLRAQSEEPGDAQADAANGGLRAEVVEAVGVKADGLLGAGVAVGGGHVGLPWTGPLVRQTAAQRQTLVDKGFDEASDAVHGRGEGLG